MNIDKTALKLMKMLEDSGYKAYAVGGCVRDLLMDKIPNDYDICTSAKPDEIKLIFSALTTIDTGIRHGTITVICDGKPFEITTMRTEGVYVDNRHPESVAFVDDIKLDLLRRDFTVNALAYNPREGIIDFFGGREDILNKTIRAVGEPDERFLEDGLRIIRGLRFSSVLGFSIDARTKESIHKNKHLLKNIASERIGEELIKLLCGDNVEEVLSEYSDVICEIIPELSETVGFSQNTKHHVYDVYTHIVKSVSNIRPDEILRMTMLLHDIGKPLSCQRDADGTTHFKGHDLMSTRLAETVLKNLRYSNSFILDVTKLIRNHDLRITPTRRAVRRAVSKIGSEMFSLFLEVQKADILAQSSYRHKEKLDGVEACEKLFYEIMKDRDCIKISDLLIDGNDVISFGYSGEKIGQLLKDILEKVMNDELENKREELIKYIEQSSR